MFRSVWLNLSTVSPSASQAAQGKRSAQKLAQNRLV